MTGREGPGVQLVEAARSFLGVPFRLHGRDPQTGLDCIGLLHVSLLAIGREPLAPTGYRLRNLDTSRWMGLAEASGLRPTHGRALAGDILLIRPGPSQHHLLICEDAGHAIHAHAGLRRVVRQQMQFPPDPIAHWRLI